MDNVPLNALFFCGKFRYRRLNKIVLCKKEKQKIYGSLKEKKISLLCTSCQFTYITIEEKFLMCPTLGRGKMGGISGRKEGRGVGEI